MTTKPPIRVGIWQAVSTKAQTAETKAEWLKQEADGRAWAEANGGRVVEVFSVPGHSRRFFSLEKLAAAAEPKGITAFSRLLALLENPQLDVIWCRGADRWARTQALFARMVEELISVHIAIYSHEDEMLIKSMKQARHWISSAGARIASDVDKLVEYRRNGMTEYMKRGLMTNSTPPRSHMVRRNPVTGKAEALVVNPATRQAYYDAAQLFISGVPFRNLERDLLIRYGHGQLKGTPFSIGHIWKILTNPITWGNVARFHYNKRGEKTARRGVHGEWAFEPGHPIPEGVEIAYNVCEPLFTGELADQIKTEMRRRWQIPKGAALRARLKLSGLVYCDECRKRMHYAMSGKHRSLRCDSHRLHRDNPSLFIDCTQTARIREHVILDWLTDEIQADLQNMPSAVFARYASSSTAVFPATDRLQQEAEGLTTQIHRLIDAQKNAGDDLFEDYQQQIAALSTRRKHVREQIASAQSIQLQGARSAERSSRALDGIRTKGVGALWESSDLEINQTLHAFMQDTVILVRDGKIVDLAPRK